MEVPESGNQFIGYPNTLYKAEFDDSVTDGGTVDEVVVTGQRYE